MSTLIWGHLNVWCYSTSFKPPHRISIVLQLRASSTQKVYSVQQLIPDLPQASLCSYKSASCLETGACRDKQLLIWPFCLRVWGRYLKASRVKLASRGETGRAGRAASLLCGVFLGRFGVAGGFSVKWPHPNLSVWGCQRGASAAEDDFQFSHTVSL